MQPTHMAPLGGGLDLHRLWAPAGAAVQPSPESTGKLPTSQGRALNPWPTQPQGWRALSWPTSPPEASPTKSMREGPAAQSPPVLSGLQQGTLERPSAKLEADPL